MKEIKKEAYSKIICFENDIKIELTITLYNIDDFHKAKDSLKVLFDNLIKELS